jgi:polyphenol oxidase
LDVFRDVFRMDGRGVYRAQALEELPWVTHGFGTRASRDWPPAVAEVATLRQIHSDKVLLADRSGCLGEGDALITNRPGIVLSIRTADCLPILIADPAKRAIAAIHAGWRGTVQEIVPKTVRAMQDQFDSQPEDLVVAVGPGIGSCCFEVGPEVAAQFGLSGRAKIDLVETIRRQLGRNDGATSQFAATGLCTVCRADLFHSYRRDREAAGRMVTVIGIKNRQAGD